MLFFLLILVFACGIFQSSAIDITTLSGKKYFDVHDVQVRGTQLTFTTDTDIVKIPLADVSPEIRQRYQPKSVEKPADAPVPAESPKATATPFPGSAHDLVVATGNKYLTQMAADLQTAHSSASVSYASSSAFTIAQLNDARKDALINGRPVAFFIIDDTLLNVPVQASETTPGGAFAHFFQTFSRSVTTVFVFPQRDLAKLPGVVSIALGKPAAIPFPRVVFTNSDISETLHDLTLATPKQTMSQRDELIYPAVGMIKRWYVKIANSVP